MSAMYNLPFLSCKAAKNLQICVQSVQCVLPEGKELDTEGLPMHKAKERGRVGDARTQINREAEKRRWRHAVSPKEIH